eukprot:maker-scaffold_9-augustus-gene-7.0-mRNA-1 protein AED:0.78 eAED:0.78 QI:0/0/0/0.5/1/1/2/0/805
MIPSFQGLTPQQELLQQLQIAQLTQQLQSNTPSQLQSTTLHPQAAFTGVEQFLLTPRDSLTPSLLSTVLTPNNSTESSALQILTLLQLQKNQILQNSQHEGGMSMLGLSNANSGIPTQVTRPTVARNPLEYLNHFHVPKILPYIPSADKPETIPRTNEETTRSARKRKRRTCSRPECTRLAQGRSTLCFSHGGGYRCSHPGCSSGSRGSSKFCIRHGGGIRCSHEGCKSSARGKTGRCISHGGGKRCSEPGCGKPAFIHRGPGLIYPLRFITFVNMKENVNQNFEKDSVEGGCGYRNYNVLENDLVKDLIFLHHSIFRNQPLINLMKAPNDALRWLMTKLQDQQALDAYFRTTHLEKSNLLNCRGESSLSAIHDQRGQNEKNFDKGNFGLNLPLKYGSSDKENIPNCPKFNQTLSMLFQKGKILLEFLINNLQGQLPLMLCDEFMTKIFLEVFKASTPNQRLQIIKLVFDQLEAISQTNEGGSAVLELIRIVNSRVEFDLLRTGLVHKFCFKSTFEPMKGDYITNPPEKNLIHGQPDFLKLLEKLVIEPWCDDCILQIFHPLNVDYWVKSGATAERQSQAKAYDFMIGITFDEQLSSLFSTCLLRFSLYRGPSGQISHYPAFLENVLRLLVTNSNLITEMCYNLTGSRIIIAIMKKLAFLNSNQRTGAIRKFFVFREKICKQLQRIGYSNLVRNPIGLVVMRSFLSSPMRPHVLRSLFGRVFAPPRGNNKRNAEHEKKAVNNYQDDTDFENLIQVFKHDTATKFLLEAIQTEKDPAVQKKVKKLLKPYNRYVSPKRMWKGVLRSA